MTILHTLRPHAFRLFASVALAAIAPATMAANHWTFIGLGTLGGRTSDAEAVSNSGVVAGWSELARLPAGDREQAFTWSHGEMSALGDPPAPGSGASRAFGVNNRGDACGTSAAGEAVVFKAGGGIGDLGVRGAGFDINDAGHVAGEYYTGSAEHAFLYSRGSLADLGTLGGTRSHANAVNSLDQVVGYASLAGDRVQHAFMYSSGTMQDLGTLGGTNSVATGINNGGIVVGYSDNAYGSAQAFVWNGTMHGVQFDVGPSFATGINDRGQVVGSAANRGFLWQDGTVTWLDEIPAVAASGWTQLSPNDIDERGWIVGRGTNAQGFYEAFVLIPRGGGK